MKSLIVSAAVSLTVLAAPSLAQAQDAAAGKKVFKRCVACYLLGHSNRIVKVVSRSGSSIHFDCVLSSHISFS